MPRSHKIIPVSLLAMLAACSSGTMVETAAPAGYPPNTAATAATVDWAHAQPVSVTLQEYAFQPSALTFQAGQAYQLRLENTGGSAHTFSSDGFFKGIAVKSVTTAKGTIDTPYVKDIEIAPKETVSLLFVPVTRGDYPLACQEPLHASLGMAGRLRIQ